MYVVKNEGSWVLFTKSNYLLNRALLNRGLGVFKKFIYSADLNYFLHAKAKFFVYFGKIFCKINVLFLQLKDKVTKCIVVTIFFANI